MDAAGISKAFQNALLGRDDEVVGTLVNYNAKAERVSVKKLIDSLSARWPHAARLPPSTSHAARLRPSRL